ncbi:MAG: YCF48-related protein [Myxococcota bacterium]|nr:YCF48-related protein [Myxococcota bacterium]
MAGVAASDSDVFVPARTASWAIPEPDLFAVDVIGDSAWAVGYWGAVLRSTDAGRTWSYAATPTDHSLYDVDFADPQHGWAVGALGTLLRTTDGGETWTPQQATQLDSFDGSERPLEANLFGVAAVSPQEAWAVGDFGVLIHTRDGTRWTPVAIPEETFGDDEIPDRIFNSVVFPDREHGWIGGEFGTTLRTEDGGETWVGVREIRGAIPDIYLFDLAPNGAGWALAGGVGGVALGSADGGQSWDALDVPTTAGLFGAAVSGDRGILVGDRGVLLVSTDAGRSWREPERPRSFNWLRGAAFDGNGKALVVGEGGMILHSSDAGDTWVRAMGGEPQPTGAVSVPEPPRTKPSRREIDGE